MQPRVSARETKDSKPLAVKVCGCCGGRRNYQSHSRVCWRGSQGPRRYTNPPTLESTPERTQSTCEKWRKWWKAGRELSKQHNFLSDAFPTYSATVQQAGLPLPGKYLRFCPLLCNSYAEPKKYGPNERTDQNPEKEPRHEEIANLLDAEFKIWLGAHRNSWVCSQNRAKSEGLKSEIK